MEEHRSSKPRVPGSSPGRGAIKGGERNYKKCQRVAIFQTIALPAPISQRNPMRVRITVEADIVGLDPDMGCETEPYYVAVSGDYYESVRDLVDHQLTRDLQALRPDTSTLVVEELDG